MREWVRWLRFVGSPGAQVRGHVFYRMLYDLVLRRVPPETAHRLAIAALRGLAFFAPLMALVRRMLTPTPELAVEAMGIRFPSPVGLAAGFDKDAAVVEPLGALGFGFVEVGTVTARAQSGNPRPRLARLPADRALVNRMGFNNEGAAAAARRLRSRNGHVIIGANIGKSRVANLDDAVDDYVESAAVLAPHVDYIAVNVSSPNTPGLRQLQHVDRLRGILTAVQSTVADAASRDVPVLVKVSPDLDDDTLDAIADLAVDLDIDGIIATNTTVSRDDLSDPHVDRAGGGGLSGAPLAPRSLAVLRQLHGRVGGQLTLISVGGIETAEDVQVRLDAGASLVQAYTALVHNGPLWAWRINRRLAALQRAGHEPHRTR